MRKLLNLSHWDVANRNFFENLPAGRIKYFKRNHSLKILKRRRTILSFAKYVDAIHAKFQNFNFKIFRITWNKKFTYIRIPFSKILFINPRSCGGA